MAKVKSTRMKMVPIPTMEHEGRTYGLIDTGSSGEDAYMKGRALAAMKRFKHVIVARMKRGNRIIWGVWGTIEAKK